ncbi:Gfo/Idh/MocA family protein [Paenibacillus apiarius]|uniref:Gfo/Idh/MocA family oxidoreductase n=2 Tax=Paenibacillus apiarius TaxID=46240 RepID=A0ABT4E146_9BACL|nr:Gfo/Idh/MocA family oxidoreductase [Paenibacillus apiarius]MCY9515726.1 Gfo/Idh/MocA family oxidoreductase [Paenibacillus apiarius]MCY9521941.1 Gfo/Idh/MocA family oxidoreductase [Paenibacillus apiarius]MCY9550487.1 Gfo/Idh/MocA family oxidoreductase [Paenibacillus apiarius]MCY9559864.1 Gfo/Idh/MocA family oxidoreductase [Paenibacillus apiarius]MCY9683452.1 Gfo/Idh/MocA family oxidoreductase [Paenibacillus apiarius]
MMTYSNERKLRFGIIGAGVIMPSHIDGIRNNGGAAEAAAICDIDIDKARNAAEKYDIPVAVADIDELLKRDDIDVVSICLPSGLHAEAAIAAAQAGKHVLCEKPIDVTLEKIDSMIAVCRQYGVKLGAVYQRRMMPAAIAAREAIAAGKLGRMVLGDAYLKYYRSPEYYKSAGWRATWELDGGGALMNQAIHGLDLVQWMMGDIESVFAYAAPLVRDIPVEDTAVVAVKYKSGAFGVIQGATSVNPAQDTRFELHGELGTIAFGDGGIAAWTYPGGEEDMPQLGTEAKQSPGSDPRSLSADGHALLVRDLIESIREDREPAVSGEEARKAVALILAIYESARTGKEVRLG